MPLLEVINVVYGAGSGGAAILDGITFALEPSEVHALLGTNGTGKSTLAYLVMGCEGYHPMSGDIVLDGTKINALPIDERARSGITMAWQEPVRFEGITVKDYLTLKDQGADAAHYLELVGLAPERYLDRMVDRCLSGGERKRIELASILALKPRLAILDEPDSGIDMLSIQDIINVINVFREEGTAVLLITHREEIAGIADQASQLCRGKITCSGNPAKVAEHYKLQNCRACNKGECHYV
ncbi:MAG: ABC transporter ATP-binding protein [Proteobacteria bacterium]|nr:ABC transporter ATP-binding protein [Desulfobulbaceae bacterium]MBU4151842.1 ABC transporter ATP-binding protein [Pseudomonadota bacterium]MDP2106836.1 ABC transporter ATP-binding protein [Desulfobulbaceae bacterium]